MCGTSVVVSVASAQDRRNGNFWVSLVGSNDIVKDTYVAGLLEGASSLGLLILAGDKPADVPHMATYLTKTGKYLDRVTTLQVRTGLDVFFSDYRNRSISITSAASVVLFEINGMPKIEIEAMVERMRAAP
ncbi:MAG: hypothetical protein A3E78_13905 [Alphaproteobacteria bacterium RIFCSPHIGHO2_12_FULL_63_12]|nr:MAG: hypothetical protein A3E78_13905 [Alphaproteobacteria bacterium RIFCSPHIGHO2_12_FULL_63_12]